MGMRPAGAASPMARARLYHVPIRRLLNAIKHGECEAPRKVGRRSVLTFAAVELWLNLESFPCRPAPSNQQWTIS